MNKRPKKWSLAAVMVSALMMVLSYVIYRTDRPYHAERIADGETIVFEGGKEIELLGVNFQSYQKKCK